MIKKETQQGPMGPAGIPRVDINRAKSAVSSHLMSSLGSWKLQLKSKIAHNKTNFAIG